MQKLGLGVDLMGLIGGCPDKPVVTAGVYEDWVFGGLARPGHSTHMFM